MEHSFSLSTAGANRPQPFGYKQDWWIIAATDPQAIAQALHLQNLQPCGWAEGIRPGPKVFVSPPVCGWTFVIGDVIQLDNHQPLGSQIKPVFQPLSRDFGIAHYFCTHRVVEYHVWALAERGTLWRCVDDWMGTRCFAHPTAIFLACALQRLDVGAYQRSIGSCVMSET